MVLCDKHHCCKLVCADATGCCSGVVCDKGLTLRDLIGTLKMFFDRLGLKKLRFKPAYNPYTEPSMEIFRCCFCSITNFGLYALWITKCSYYST